MVSTFFILSIRVIDSSLRIYISILFRLEKIPRNLTAIAREVFTLAVCMKPRLINRGLERLKPQNNSNDALDGMKRILYSKGKQTTSYKIYKHKYVYIKVQTYIILLYLIFPIHNLQMGN